MKINIVGRQLNVYDDTKKLINEKLSKLNKFFSDECTATVTLSHKHGVANMEITIRAANTIFRSEVEEESFRSALDKSIDNIERQIRKNKTRLQKRLREGGLSVEDKFEIYDNLEDIQEEGEFVIRTKKFEYSPMSPEEAIMQMNLLGHSFYIFQDADTGEVRVVYLRSNGDIGLLIPRKARH